MKIVLWIVASLVALIALAATVLWLMGKREGAGTVVTQIEIAQPPAEIWKWIVEPEKLRSWVSWTVEVREETAGLTRVGSRRTIVMEDRNNNNQRMEIQSEVTALDQDRMMAVRLDAPQGFTGDIAYQLTDLGSGRTRLEYRSRFRFTNAFAQLMEPLITSAAKKKALADVDHLKELAEAGLKR